MTVNPKSTAALILTLILGISAGVWAADDWFATGLSALKTGQFAEALSAFNKAIEKDPQHANAYNGRGAVWHKLGAYERAAADYTKAISLTPGYANAYNNRGVARYQQKKFTEAIKDYERALSINPNYANALSNRGAAWEKKGEYEQAIADFEAALSIRTAYETYNLMAWILATCPDKRFRNGPRAVALAQKAVAMKTDARSLGTLAAAFAEAGQFADAVEKQKQVIDLLQKSGAEKALVEHMARLEDYQAGGTVGEKTTANRVIEEETLTASTPPPPTHEKQKPAEKTPVPVMTSKKPPLKYPYTIQISSFRNRQTAYRVAAKYKKKGDVAFNALARVPSKGGDWYRLFMGIYPTYDEAEAAADVLRQRKFRSVQVLKMPWAVELAPSDTEERLGLKGYVPYRIPSYENRLVVGAFSSKKEAETQADELRKEGFTPRIFRR